MFAIIGILIVFGSIVGGYLMEKGNLLVLVQPAELLIIGGAAVGTILAANPISIVKRIVDLHAGRIMVESAGQGKGATFKMQLPMR